MLLAAPVPILAAVGISQPVRQTAPHIASQTDSVCGVAQRAKVFSL